jgi:hypothetical protein
VDGVLFDRKQATLLRYPGGKTGGYVVPKTVTSIGAEAFADSAQLTSVVVGDSVTNIGSGAFRWSTRLGNVRIGDNVTVLGEGAFQGCRNLTNVTVGRSVATIKGFCFSYCPRLTSFDIPDSVTSLGIYAFEYCTGLNQITVGGHLARISFHAFAGCTNLKGAYFQGYPPSLDSQEPVFSPDTTVYYLPEIPAWGKSFGGSPTAEWKPQLNSSDAGFGMGTNQFGFNGSWAKDKTVIVEVCEDIVNPTWSAVATNVLATGSFSFGDKEWRRYPARFYRVRSP